MGTFSKSLASLGGFLAANSRVVDYVRHHSRPFIFSASIPPANCAVALEALRQMKPSALGPGTTLLILSDTKTIDLPRAARELLEAKRLAGKVLWLNPIPERKWPYVRSIETMSALCQMVPCSTLEELARACRRLLEH